MIDPESLGSVLMIAALLLIFFADHYEQRKRTRYAEVCVVAAVLAFLAGVYLLEPFTRT